MASKNVILQWNCDGLRKRRNDLDILIATYNPAIICLQETLLPFHTERCHEDNLPLGVIFKKYTGYFKCIPSGKNGIAIYVRKGISHSHIKLKTSLQALAVRVTFKGKEFIVSNHYTSDTHDGVPRSAQFEYIVNQFDRPYIMCGDFNAHHSLWSHDKNDPRGKQLETFITQNDLGLLNSNITTHCNRKTHEWSLLDLSLIHPALYMDFDAEVLTDLYNSDHAPIIIKLNGELFETDKRARWNFKRADWDSFRVQCQNELVKNIFNSEEDEMKVFTEKLLEIATEKIPMT